VLPNLFIAHIHYGIWHEDRMGKFIRSIEKGARLDIFKYTKLTVECVMRESTMTVFLKGYLSFESVLELRKKCKSCLADSAIKEIVLNLSEVKSIDSFSLGFLLELRENAHLANKALLLASISRSVKSKFEIANFDRLFAIV